MSNIFLNLPDFNDDVRDDMKILFIGMSGGVDSQVLAHLVANDKNLYNTEIVGVHVNYGLTNSDQREKLVIETANKLDFPVVVRVADKSVVTNRDGSFSETKARDYRFKVFSSLRKEYKLDYVNVFLGHHLDDQVETFFMKFLRGSGVRGLKAMNRITKLPDMVVFRPLLSYSKKEIIEYARENGIDYIDDVENFVDTHDRNFIRNKVLPLMESRYPALKKNVEKTLFALNDSLFCLDDLALSDLRKVSENDKISVDKIKNFENGRLSQQRIRNMLLYYINSKNFTASYQDLIRFTNNLVRDSSRVEMSLVNKSFTGNSQKYLLKRNGKYLEIVESNRKNQKRK
jgi:tRNA(Ile)-lysidine synthase